MSRRRAWPQYTLESRTLNTTFRRPIVWTRHSTILMGHPTQPAVYGRAFPSSRPFIVPSPALVLSGTYGPPTNLSICPDDKHLFAYFPPLQGPSGVACLWAREQADVWNVKECWLSNGCVTIAWLGAPREVCGTLTEYDLVLKATSVGSWRKWSFKTASSRSTDTSCVGHSRRSVSRYAIARVLPQTLFRRSEHALVLFILSG